MKIFLNWSQYKFYKIIFCISSICEVIRNIVVFGAVELDFRNSFKWKQYIYILIFANLISYNTAYADIKKYRLYKRYVNKNNKKKKFGDDLTDNYYVGCQINIGMSLGTMFSGFSQKIPYIDMQLDDNADIKTILTTRGSIHLKANIPYSIGMFAKYRPIKWLGFEFVSVWCPTTGIRLSGRGIIDKISKDDIKADFTFKDHSMLPLKYIFKTAQFEYTIKLVFHQGEFFETLGLKIVNIGPTGILRSINYNKLRNTALKKPLSYVFGQKKDMRITSPNITRIHPYFIAGIGYEFNFGLGFDVNVQFPLKISMLTQYSPANMKKLSYWERILCTNNNLFITSLIFFSKSIFEISIRCNGLKSYFYLKKMFG